MQHSLTALAALAILMSAAALRRIVILALSLALAF
jgi:hypothetical protein